MNNFQSPRRSGNLGVEYHTMSPDLVLCPIGAPAIRYIDSPDVQPREQPAVIQRPVSLNGNNSHATAYFYSLHSPYTRYYVNAQSPCLGSSSKMKEDSSPLASPAPSGLGLSSRGSIASICTSSGCDEHFKSVKHAELALKRMESYYSQGQLCDVTLVAGDKKIRAHRLILSAASDYFSAMFTSEVLEATQEEVHLKTMDPDALRTLVDYCYTGSLELNEETVEVILSTAHHLLLAEVVEICCKFLTKQLHPANCLGIQLFADAQGCVSLHSIAIGFTAQHFLEVIQNQEFLQLPKAEVLILLSSDDLNVPSEETIFQALMLWLNHDLENRKKDVAELLALVKLPLLSPSYLIDHIETNQIFRENCKCQELIMEALKYHLLPERRSTLQSLRTKPRKSTVGSLYLVGGNKVAPNTIERFDLRTNSWETVSTKTGRRLQGGVAVMEGRVYIAGGREGLKTLNTFEFFEPKNGVWSSLQTMGTHRHGLGVGVLGGPMYAVGGHDGWSYLSSVERWDPETRQWNYVAQMNSARSTAGVAVLNGKLYAVGGRDGSACLRSVECYDPHTDKWAYCTSMTQRRGGVAVGVVNGFLYAVGGHDAPASNPSASRFDCVERYDPTTDTWTQVASLLAGCDSAGICLMGNKLYCVGGYDGQTYLSIVQVYDPQTNEWTQAAPLPSGRASACVVVIPNTVTRHE